MVRPAVSGGRDGLPGSPRLRHVVLIFMPHGVFSMADWIEAGAKAPDFTLVTDDGTVSDLPFGEFRDRNVYVVDVANLEEDACLMRARQRSCACQRT